MADYHDLVQALTWLLVNKLQFQAEYTRGILGDGQGRVQVPDRPDYSYVRPDRYTTRVGEFFNKMVSGPDGLPVVLGELPWQPGLTQVLAVDWDTYLGVGWGDATPGLPRHGQTHQWRDGAPGYDAFNVYRRQMGDLRTYPVGSGSTSIYVSNYNFTHLETVKSWSGLPGLNLSGAIPSVTGTARFVLTYWDPCSGTSGFLGVATGTLGVDAAPEVLNRPAAPAGTIPSAWVRLAGGQTSITEFDIWDARPLWVPSTKFATGSCGIWAGLIPIGDPGLNFTGTTVEAALEELADGGGGSPSGPAGGDLTGTYPNPLMVGLWGYPLVPVAPAEGDLLMFTGSAWRPTAGVDDAWPFNIVTVDATDPKADYDSLETAFATEGSQTAFVVGPGQWNLTANGLPEDSWITTWNKSTQWRVSGYVIGGAMTGLPIDVNGYVQGVEAIAYDNAGNDAEGIRIGAGAGYTYLWNCQVEATAAAGSGDAYAVHNVSGSSALHIFGGTFTATSLGGSEYCIKSDASVVYLNNLPILNAGQGEFFTGSGSFEGLFQDNDGNLWSISGVAGTERQISGDDLLLFELADKDSDGDYDTLTAAAWENSTVSGSATIDWNSVFGVPDEARAVNVRMFGRDATVGAYVGLKAKSTTTNDTVRLWSLVASEWNEIQATVPIASDGTSYYSFSEIWDDFTLRVVGWEM